MKTISQSRPMCKLASKQANFICHPRLGLWQLHVSCCITRALRPVPFGFLPNSEEETARLAEQSCGERVQLWSQITTL